MGEVYYKKVGRKYIPVAEHFSWDSWPDGDYLVSIYPGGLSMTRCVEPALAHVQAAMRVAGNGMCKAMRKASEARPSSTPLTDEQVKAWHHLKEVMGSDVYLKYESYQGVVDAGIAAVTDEIKKRSGHAR